MDEWLIRTIMALYTEDCTVVRTDDRLCESFEVKIGLHQGSVLSPLLFAAVMDVVSNEERSGLPSELLNADGLVIMVPTMEQLGRQVADWRASMFGKGLKMNAGKSKVMVGSSGGKMIVNSGKWPCGVCGKGVQANSVQYTVCKKWIHKRCSGVHGDSLRVADGCCLPSETYGRNGATPIFRFFFTELPVPPQAAVVVGTFNVLDIYPSEHYGLSFFGPYRCLFFTVSFFFSFL